MNANEVIQRLDGADLFLRNRANAAPAPLNEYDTYLMMDAAEACNEASALIDCQKAEIERLKKNIDGLNIFTTNHMKVIRLQSIKEFVERLKEIIYTHENRVDVDGIVLLTHIDNSIDNLVKEMTEEGK